MQRQNNQRYKKIILKKYPGYNQTIIIPSQKIRPNHRLQSFGKRGSSATNQDPQPPKKENVIVHPIPTGISNNNNYLY